MNKYGRRQLLTLVILLGAALVVSCQSPGLVIEKPPTEEPTTDLSYLVDMHPANVDNSELPITPVDELHTTQPESVEVDIEQYRLIIDGLVENPLTLTYQEILTYPTVTEVVLLICPGFFADNAEWTGVPVKTLLAEAGVKPEATEVIFHGLDGYHSSISLETAQESGPFLAHMVNGQVLPAEHGYPLRLVVKHHYGSEWVKWVEHISVQ
jgi:sulfoxide reductase catalytic subunit YedY